MSIIVKSRIYDDDVIIYDNRREGYELEKLTVLTEIDGAGSAEITMPPGHCYIDNFGQVLGLYAPTITICEEVDDWIDVIFRGRVVSNKADFYGRRTAVLEGERAFLKDSVLRPDTYTFAEIIAEHNAQVGESRQFTVYTNAFPSATVTVDDAMLTSDAIKKLLAENGGRITFGGITDRKINWTTAYGTGYQPIEFGSNLLDLSTVRLNQNYANRIIPYGAKSGNSRVTISVDGHDYVEDPDAVELYGAISAAVIYNDITTAAALETAARRELAKRSSLVDTISLKVLDLYGLTCDPEYSPDQMRYIFRLAVGDMVPVKYPLLDVDESMLVTQRKYDLLDRKNDSVTVGGKTVALSDDLV